MVGVAVRGAVVMVLAAAVLSPGNVRAQAPVAPAAALAAARAAMTDTVRGKELRVTLLTVGQGEAVWERFGHNMIWIVNERTGEAHVWNWGLFDFAAPGFVRRFLFASGMYWVGDTGIQRTLDYYHSVGRDVVAQELALTPGQRAALDALVRVNALEENRFYRYDYFLDNCSTRARDALDIVLGGALRTALEPVPANVSYRTETLRLNVVDPWLFLGMDIALGAPADRPLNAWQAGFIPMRLRDALRTVSVKDASGRTVPLVKTERVLVRPTRPPESQTLDAPWPRVVMIATLALTLLLVGLGVLSGRGVRAARPAIVALSVAVHVPLGLLSSLVLFVWLFTRHTFWAWNPHLLLFTPASLVIAVLIPLWRNRWKPGNWIEVYHVAVGVVAFLLVLGILVTYRTHVSPAAGLLLMWANLSWMIHLGLAVALARLPGERGSAGATGRMDGTRAT